MIENGDRLVFDGGQFSGRKAVVINELVTRCGWQGFEILFEDRCYPVTLEIEFKRDWAVDISFYRGVHVSHSGYHCWTAYYENDEERSDRYGVGSTKQEALDDLGQKLLERVDDRLYDMNTDNEWDAATMDDCFTAIDGLEYPPY